MHTMCPSDTEEKTSSAVPATCVSRSCSPPLCQHLPYSWYGCQITWHRGPECLLQLGRNACSVWSMLTVLQAVACCFFICTATHQRRNKDGKQRLWIPHLKPAYITACTYITACWMVLSVQVWPSIVHAHCLKKAKATSSADISSVLSAWVAILNRHVGSQL